MDETQLRHLEGLLIAAEKAAHEDLLLNVDRKEAFNDVASEAPDPGDASFAILTVDLGNTALARDVQKLRSIQAALERIRNGTYGDCEECGYAIPYERLQVQLTAQRCAPCQAVYEKTHADALKGASM